jgi:hypothetical protein
MWVGLLRQIVLSHDEKFLVCWCNEVPRLCSYVVAVAQCGRFASAAEHHFIGRCHRGPHSHNRSRFGHASALAALCPVQSYIAAFRCARHVSLCADEDDAIVTFALHPRDTELVTSSSRSCACTASWLWRSVAITIRGCWSVLGVCFSNDGWVEPHAVSAHTISNLWIKSFEQTTQSSIASLHFLFFPYIDPTASLCPSFSPHKFFLQFSFPHDENEQIWHSPSPGRWPSSFSTGIYSQDGARHTARPLRE